MPETVCAVVVTYNRKALLRRCLQAVLAQTHPPNTVLVVNNASTDGTAAMLTKEFPTVQQLYMEENLGGAGGFHHGIAQATALGFDWISVMDDDGQPAPDCFERLLACPNPSLQVRGALVIDEADDTQLAFPLHVTKPPLTSFAEAQEFAIDGMIRDHVTPFNGLFIANTVVKTIGLPEMGFFFWGDEYEYFLRMKRAGVPLGLVTDARFYHPRNRMLTHKVRLLFKELPVYYADNPLKDYLIVRNQAYILKKYRGWLGWAAHVARYLVFYGQQSRWQQFGTVVSASWHGAWGDFTHHQKYLA